MTDGLVLGVGGRAAASTEALLALATQVLADQGRELGQVRTVATLDRRADHPGVRRLVEVTGGRLVALDAATLAGQPVEQPSERVDRHVGTPSVAEAAARAVGGVPIGERHHADGWTLMLGRLHDLDHHGDREVGPGMVDLAVNVHDTAPPAFLAERLTEAVAELAAYPDPTRATAAVAEAHGVPPESVLLTHGAAEAFTLIAQQPWRRPCVIHPQFTEPEAALVAHGHAVDRLLLTAEDGFGLGGARPAAAADLVMLGNPTNPTSRLHDPADITALAADSDGPRRLVVVDEAFLDTVEGLADPVHSLVRGAAEEPRLAVVRSLTKTYSIAGLRIGYVVTHPDVVTRLTRKRPPWPVGTLALAAAEACVSDQGRHHAAAVRRELPGRLAHLVRGLRARDFEVVEDPRAPFVLARHARATHIRAGLRDLGVVARRGDTFPGLDHTWLRLAARDEPTVDQLFEALDRLASPRSRS